MSTYPKNQSDHSKTGRPFLRTPEAAAYLNVGKSTLEKWRCFGGGPQYAKLGPRVIIYDPDVLDAFAAEYTRRSTSQEKPDPEAYRAAEQVRRGCRHQPQVISAE